jgi:hypothetical protein
MFEFWDVCILVMQRQGVSLTLSNKALFIEKMNIRTTPRPKNANPIYIHVLQQADRHIEV